MPKDETISELVQARSRIVDAAAKLPPGKQDEVFLGKWSVKDLLAHLVGWDYANLESTKELLSGKRPTVYTRWNADWAAYNAELVYQHKHGTYEQMLRQLAASHAELIRFLESLPPDAFEKERGHGFSPNKPITIASYLQVEIDDELEHLGQIKSWLESG